MLMNTLIALKFIILQSQLICSTSYFNRLWWGGFLVTLDTRQEAPVGWFLFVVLIPKQARTFALEDTWNPRVFVRDTPNRHSNTPLDSETRPGHTLPSRNLQSSLLGVGGRVKTNVDLSVGHIDAEIGSSAESSLKGLLIRSGARGSRSALRSDVTLVTYTIDMDTIRLDEFNNTSSTCSLGTIEFKVVIVVWYIVSTCFQLGEKQSENLQNSLALLSYFFASLKAMGKKASPMVSYQTLLR